MGHRSVWSPELNKDGVRMLKQGIPSEKFNLFSEFPPHQEEFNPSKALPILWSSLSSFGAVSLQKNPFLDLQPRK